MLALVSSEALEEEVLSNPNMQRRAEAQTILSLAVSRIQINGRLSFGHGIWQAWATDRSTHFISRPLNPLAPMHC